MKDILLVTINAKWIHPSLALRLLKANLGSLEDHCEIFEFAPRQSHKEKIDLIITARPKILGISVSIWNHAASIELLDELEKFYLSENPLPSKKFPVKPIVVLGGPEVSHLPSDAKIFRYADYVIRGEGEIAFKTLCEDIFSGNSRPQLSTEFPAQENKPPEKLPQFINTESVNINEIKSAYNLYTDHDLAKKLIYVESCRGCPFNCEFCLSAVKPERAAAVREFPLEPFLAEMDILIQRGAKRFKFLDRTFNANIKRAVKIMEFFLEKIEKEETRLHVHFEMIPSVFPKELNEIISRFPPETLRLEIGIQTLNPEIAVRIKLPGRHPSNPCKELETLSFLREKTNAIIHVDLIAGLPGEDLESFGRGFNDLWHALSPDNSTEESARQKPWLEIQLGILKQLPGAPIRRHNESFGMCFNPSPPYEIMETTAMPAFDLNRIKNFARFWELIVNRYNFPLSILYQSSASSTLFDNFMTLSDLLLIRFGRNWGIDKNELWDAIQTVQ